MNNFQFPIYNFQLILILVMLLSGCGKHPSLPQDYTQKSEKPDIYPDYTDVTVPVNIAPLNFMVEQADEVVARIQAGDVAYSYGKGNKVIISQKEWRKLLNAAKGGKMMVDVYCKYQDQWSRYEPFFIEVATDSIDSYISY